ncbi:Os06g0606900 [Oryza sativa Japonica Group]|uniref:Os06g0606900 protein n=1 Tax=Oryza sativa subsp. japonica TaxID=39947 RepID=Q0DB32_ORYSJ|nr:Os06g0606900 [Oryza sativa Japonica Group]|eukprot:NP_001058027.1 Os06g0606900 [Oryza sativa Japonica Group]
MPIITHLESHNFHLLSLLEVRQYLRIKQHLLVLFLGRNRQQHIPKKHMEILLVQLLPYLQRNVLLLRRMMDPPFKDIMAKAPLKVVHRSGLFQW